MWSTMLWDDMYLIQEAVYQANLRIVDEVYILPNLVSLSQFFVSRTSANSTEKGPCNAGLLLSIPASVLIHD